MISKGLVFYYLGLSGAYHQGNPGHGLEEAFGAFLCLHLLIKIACKTYDKWQVEVPHVILLTIDLNCFLYYHYYQIS